MNDFYLVWLEWPEECFRANAKDIQFLRALVSGKGRVVHVRSEKSFLANLSKATHVITWHFKKEWYGRAKSLKVLATPAAGREFIAWKDAPDHIKVHFGGFHGDIIGESVLAFCMAWQRGFFKIGQMRLKGEDIWPREKISGFCRSIVGTKAVVVGKGNVGGAVGRILSKAGVDVCWITRRNINELRPALKKADWVVLALPGDTGTDNFLNAERIGLMQKKAVVVNVGRGNAVDEVALASALDKGLIAGAYLDVFKGEPTQLGGKLPKSPLWDHSCVVAMPHASAFSPDYVKLAFKELCDEGYL